MMNDLKNHGRWHVLCVFCIGSDGWFIQRQRNVSGPTSVLLSSFCSGLRYNKDRRRATTDVGLVAQLQNITRRRLGVSQIIA